MKNRADLINGILIEISVFWQKEVMEMLEIVSISFYGMERWFEKKAVPKSTRFKKMYQEKSVERWI